MMYQGYGMGAGGWLVMTLILLAGVGLVAAVTVAVVRGVRPPVQGTAAGDPERILAGRFARGVIDAEEYETRLRILRTASS